MVEKFINNRTVNIEKPGKGTVSTQESISGQNRFIEDVTIKV